MSPALPRLPPALHLLGCVSCDPAPTPPLCSRCSSISVTLGAHNIKEQERTQQVIPVRRAIPHPDYNHKNFSNDIMLLQVRRPPCCSCPGSTLFPLPLGPVPSLLLTLAA
ncbi:hypothetical protein MC885_009676 [Smutsia gigantea]|nr:hypothetical protein MC885_009676 [Smutsia gigantea]